MTTRHTVSNSELFQSDNCSLRKLVQAVYTYPFQVCVIMIRLGERMTIKLRKNIMFRGLQRWDGCDRFT